MKRLRLSTLLLLVVIAAFSLALVAQAHKAARREVELEARRAELEQVKANMMLQMATKARSDEKSATKGADH